MEIEYFVQLDDADSNFNEWLRTVNRFVDLGQHAPLRRSHEERAHHSAGTIDVLSTASS